MNRKLLEDLGLEAEVIDSIMASHGKHLKGAIAKAEQENAQLKEQLAEAKGNLDKYNGVDVGSLNEKISELERQIASKDAEFEQEKDELQFQSTVLEEIKAAGAKDVDLVKAVLNLDEIRASDNRVEAMRAALDAVLEEKGFLFGKDDGTDDTMFKVSTGASHSEQVGGTVSTNDHMNELIRGTKGE